MVGSPPSNGNFQLDSVRAQFQEFWSNWVYITKMFENVISLRLSIWYNIWSRYVLPRIFFLRVYVYVTFGIRVTQLFQQFFQTSMKFLIYWCPVNARLWAIREKQRYSKVYFFLPVNFSPWKSENCSLRFSLSGSVQKDGKMNDFFFQLHESSYFHKYKKVSKFSYLWKIFIKFYFQGSFNFLNFEKFQHARSRNDVFLIFHFLGKLLSRFFFWTLCAWKLL